MEDGTIYYLDSSNNGDMVKIFSAIIKCIKIFTNDFPDRIIYFTGNTEQKTRVYNEIIRRHYSEFSVVFGIFGEVNIEGETKVQKFDPNIDYAAFYLKLKK